MRLGAGRERVESIVDHAVGIVLRGQRGDKVDIREPVYEMHCRDGPGMINAAIGLMYEAIRVSDAPPESQPLVLETIP